MFKLLINQIDIIACRIKTMCLGFISKGIFCGEMGSGLHMVKEAIECTCKQCELIVTRHRDTHIFISLDKFTASGNKISELLIHCMLHFQDNRALTEENGCSA